MKYFALTYDVVSGFADRRMAYREAHLKRVREAHDRGELMMAGAVGDPPDGALLVFRSESAAVAEEFARTDPYVTEGLVTDWRVRPWNVVIGPIRHGASDSEPAVPKPL
jgi:uncharacterized protein YciI